MATYPRASRGEPRTGRQWLYDGDRLGLVDFDGYCLGDPELDAATFIVGLEKAAKSARQPRLDAAGHAARHLAAARRMLEDARYRT